MRKTYDGKILRLATLDDSELDNVSNLFHLFIGWQEAEAEFDTYVNWM